LHSLHHPPFAAAAAAAARTALAAECACLNTKKKKKVDIPGILSNVRELQIAKLRLQLQRSKQVTRQSKDRDLQLPQLSPHGTAGQTQHKGTTAAFPAAPLTKTLICRVPSNVEGINHELENVFIREDWEQGMQAMEAVDGRRPPFPTHRHSSGRNTRDTDTQAPSSGDSSPSPRPYSADLLQSPGGSPCSAEDTDKEGVCSSPLPKFATSPKPNNSYMFKREPPEGCEKVKVFDELM
uniref:Glucocorticoid induced 1a n=1 Tax=Oryzias latipes TaxID=8090 RepID=A0A3P9JKR1_ORYLA